MKDGNINIYIFEWNISVLRMEQVSEELYMFDENNIHINACIWIYTIMYKLVCVCIYVKRDMNGMGACICLEYVAL